MRYTKHQLDEAMERRFTELLIYCGGYVHLAKMLDVPVSTAQGWYQRNRISKQGAILVGINEYLGVTFPTKYLRPDM